MKSRCSREGRRSSDKDGVAGRVVVPTERGITMASPSQCLLDRLGLREPDGRDLRHALGAAGDAERIDRVEMQQAGGISLLLRRLLEGGYLRADCATVTGQSLGDAASQANAGCACSAMSSVRT